MDEKTKARYLGDIEYFTAKLQMDKGSMLFIPLASAQLNLGMFEEAKQVLFDGLDANPDLSSAKTLLAQAYIGLKQYDDAKGLLTEIRVIDSANYLAEKLLGDIYREESDLKKAIISYRNAYTAAPEDGELKELIQNLMSESGLDANELLDDRPMGLDEEELLDTLGQELAEEVRQEIGETKQTVATDEEVRKTVDEIVGTDEESLDIYAEEDSSTDSFEMEEESLASVDDEIIPTKSIIDFADLTADEPEEQEQEDEPSDDMGDIGDISDMAAELSEDLGLDTPRLSEEQENIAEEDVLPDVTTEDAELSAAESEITDDTLSEDSFVDELLEAKLKDAEDKISESEFDVSAIMGEEAYSASDTIETAIDEPEKDEMVIDDFDFSNVGDDMADLDSIITDTPQAEQDEGVISAESTEDTVEEPIEDTVEDTTQEEAETADEIIPHGEESVHMIDAQSEEITFSPDEISALQDELRFDDETQEETAAVEPDEVYNMSPEDEKIITQAKTEMKREEKINDELAILFAMEELEEKARQGVDKEYVSHAADDILSDVKSRYPEGLDNETYEQVSRLENLLEIIKNNAK